MNIVMRRALAMLSMILLLSGITMAQENVGQSIVEQGFEKTDGLGSNFSGQKGGLSEENPHGGKSCAYLKNESNADLFMVISQGFKPPEEGSKVTVSLWVRTDSPNTKFMAYCDLNGVVPGEGDAIKWLAGAPGDAAPTAINGRDWKKVEFSFIFPKNQPENGGRVFKICWLQMVLKTPGTVWFDDLSITGRPITAQEKSEMEKPVPAPPPAVVAPSVPQPSGELVTNGGFEDADAAGIKGWSAVPFAVVSSTDIFADGKRSLRINCDREGEGTMSAQDIKQFAKDKTYRFQYEARVAKLGQEYRAYIGIWKGDKWLDGVDTQWRQGKENEWQKISTDFTLSGATSEADRLMVVLQIRNAGTVWFDNVSIKPVEKSSLRPNDKEEKIAQVLPPPLEPFIGSEKYVQIMPDRTFRMQGKPFFPIKIWGVTIETQEMLAAIHDFGFNVVGASHHSQEMEPAVAQLYLDMAKKHELKMILLTWVGLPERQVAAQFPERLKKLSAVINEVKNHPALFAYCIADEPAWSGYDLTTFGEGARAIRALDPNHPLYINHAPRNTIAELARYNQYVDIAGSDIYPVWKTGIDNHSDLPNKTLSVVGDETIKNIAAVGPGKPVFEILQGFSWSEIASVSKEGHPFPTQHQLRFMGYDSVACGASGVCYYQDWHYRQLRPELKPIVREFHAMQDILASGQPLATNQVCTNDGIKLLIKEYHGYRIIVAVNRSAAPVNATFNLAPLLVKSPDSIQVLFEKRRVTANSLEFTDRFEPFDVHIYTDCMEDSAILRAFVPLQIASFKQQSMGHRVNGNTLLSNDISFYI